MHRPCPSPFSSPSSPPFVDTLAAVLHVVDASAAGSPGASFVLVLDDDDRLLTVVVLTDAADDVNGLVAACVALLDASAGGRWRSTVLVSDRAGRGALADADERAAWCEIGRACSGAGVTLVDWLLLDGDLVGSLAGQVEGLDVWPV